MSSSIIASSGEIWAIIAALAVGTYLIRLSFLGIIGGRELPSWLLRLLRYTPVAVLPGIATPMIINGGSNTVDASQIAAAIATVGVGLALRNTLYAIIAGLVVFFIFSGLTS